MIDLFKTFRATLFCMLWLVFSASVLNAEESPALQSLEELKKQVLSINRELFILEEDLLFPASTQVAFFVSVDVGHYFKLDSIKLTLDDKVLTQYLYTDREIDALRRGGVQRLYVDNLANGEHLLVATVIGYGPERREYKLAISHEFAKDTEAKLLEFSINDDSSKQQPKLSVKEWN